MKIDLKPPFCSEHHISMTWGETQFTYKEDGVEVTVSHIPAWVCPHQDDSAFAPGVMDDLIATIRQLIKVAKQARTQHGALPTQEYLVKIAA